MSGLKRGEVARRLRKSVATVRRLEGHILFPSRDQRGIYRFDEWEVERLIKNPERARRWARSQWFERRANRAAKSRRVLADPAEHVPIPLKGLLLAVLERLSDIAPPVLRRAGIDEDFLNAIEDAIGKRVERPLSRSSP